MAPELTTWLTAWEWRPGVAAMLGALAGLYLTGWVRLRRRQRAAVRVRDAAVYLTGLGLIGVALLSPLAPLGGLFFTAHMLQHQLLALAAAPLLLLANPFPALVWGLPARLRAAVAGLFAPRAAGRRALRALTAMPIAWTVYNVVLAGWHHPAAFEAALRDPLLHDVQHLSVFLTAGLFWWPVVDPAPRVHGPIPYGLRLLYVLAALILPGVFIMPIPLLVREPLYPYYASVPRLFGVTAIEDQDTAWVAMALGDALVYGVALFGLFGRMLHGRGEPA